MKKHLLFVVVTCSLVDWADAAPVDYFTNVEPLLRKHCTVCHNDQTVEERDTSGGLSLSSPDRFLASKSLVIAGQPDKSSLIQRVTSADVEKRMPKDGQPLTRAEVETLSAWVKAGAPLGEKPASGQKTRSNTSSRKKIEQEVTIDLEARVPPNTLASKQTGPVRIVAKTTALPAVTSLAFSPSGRYLAIGTYQQIVVWDFQRNGDPVVWSDPMGVVHSLAFSPKEDLLWSAGGEAGVAGEVKAYRLADRTIAYQLRDGADVFSSLAVAPKTGVVVALGYDRFLRVLDVTKPAPIRSFKVSSDQVFSVALSADGNQALTAGKDRMVKLWDVTTGKAIRTLPGHNRDVLAVQFGADEKNVLSVGEEPDIRVWNLAKGDVSSRMNGHGGAVYQMEWSRDRTRLASAGADRSVRVWRADYRIDKTLTGMPDVIYAVALAPTGKWVAAGGWDGVVRMWDVNTGKLILTLLVPPMGSTRADWLAVHPNGWASVSPGLAQRTRWLVGQADAPEAAKRAVAPASLTSALAGGPSSLPFVPPPAVAATKSAPVKAATAKPATPVSNSKTTPTKSAIKPNPKPSNSIGDAKPKPKK